MFSFYNDQLFRIVVDYSHDRTEGMTQADMIEALSDVYGAVLPKTTRSAGRVASAVETESGSPFARWGDALSAWTIRVIPVGFFAFLVFLPWAYRDWVAFDTPFPYWKRWAGAEGGVADMCLVSWPAQIAPDPVPRQQYVHAVDVVPTIYGLLGIEPPEVIKGYVQSPIEGESFAASLLDPAAPERRTQFYAMLGQRSIYHDGWLASTLNSSR